MKSKNICCTGCKIADLCRNRSTVTNLADEVDSVAEDLDDMTGITFQVEFNISCSRRVD